MPIVSRLLDAPSRWKPLDPAVGWTAPLGLQVERLPLLRSTLRGEWLGHPVHPALAVLPLGFSVSAATLALTPSTRQAATPLVELALASAAPTALTGLIELGVLRKKGRRVAFAHAGINVVGLALQAASLRRRVDGPDPRLLWAGVTFSTLAAALGGHLAYHYRASLHGPKLEGRRALRPPRHPVGSEEIRSSPVTRLPIPSPGSSV
jgi:hypothetical protein